MAKLYYMYGPMNSGKTVNLSKDAFNYEEVGLRAIVMKPALDSRGKEGMLSSRIESMSRTATLFGKDEDLYATICALVKGGEGEVGAVFIDEAQFLTRDQVFQLSHIPDYLDIPVLCYGLRTDAFGRAFEGSLALFEIADEMKEVKGMCSHSRSKATMVYRVDENGVPQKNGDVVQIGGNDSYKACSRKVYKEKVLEIKDKDDAKQTVSW